MAISVLNTSAALSGKTLPLLESANTFTGFGVHTFSAGGTGGNYISLRNTSAGTGNHVFLGVGNDTTAFMGGLYATASNYTPSTIFPQDGVAVYCTNAGGLSVGATHASGAIRFYSGGSTLRGQFVASGSLQLVTALVVNQGGTPVQTVDTAGFHSTAWPTTANAANLYSADGNYILRSTSSLRYKTDVERLDAAHALDVVKSLSPITYRGINDGETRFAGFAAEEVAALDPMLVTFDKEGRPDYVTYDRVPAYLVPVAQNHEARLADLEAEIRRLKGLR